VTFKCLLSTLNKTSGSLSDNISLAYLFGHSRKNFIFPFSSDSSTESKKTIRIIITQSQFGLPLPNIHISNDNGSFIFYVDVFFPLSLRLDFYRTVYMTNTTVTAYPW